MSRNGAPSSLAREASSALLLYNGVPLRDSTLEGRFWPLNSLPAGEAEAEGVASPLPWPGHPERKRRAAVAAAMQARLPA
jgi:hypothetical protein